MNLTRPRPPLSGASNIGNCLQALSQLLSHVDQRLPARVEPHPSVARPVQDGGVATRSSQVRHPPAAHLQQCLRAATITPLYVCLLQIRVPI